LLDIANDEGNLQEVIAYSNLILRDEPNNIGVLLNLSAGLYFSEQYGKVLDVNDKIIGLDKTIPEAFLNKAYTYLKMGDKEKAQFYLNKGKLLNPSHGDVKTLENILSSME
jgi:tetratricopeptide (TPR) repeat protein